MSETGQGIIYNDQEDTLILNSECANAWGMSIMSLYAFLIQLTLFCPDLINATFPWYKHMHAIMGTSHVVSKVALTHSYSID